MHIMCARRMKIAQTVEVKRECKECDMCKLQVKITHTVEAKCECKVQQVCGAREERSVTNASCTP